MQAADYTNEAGSSEQPSSRPAKERHLGLDFGRLTAAFFVVAIHAGPGTEAPGFSGELLNQAARFAVPFFFCVSGWLFARSYRHAATWHTLWRYEWRILSLFLFWSAVYFLNPSIAAIQEFGWFESYRERWHFLTASPVQLMLNGTALHLWYLVSLAMGLFLVWLVNRRTAIPGVLLGSLLYLIALAAGPYHGSVLSIDLGLNPRDGPFFSTIFVALGFLTGWIGFKPGRRMAWLCFAAGAIVHGLEITRFYLLFHASPFGYNFVIGTLFFGYGAFLLAISWEPSGLLDGLARLGPLATGIYCVHVLFVKKMDFFDVFFPSEWWGFARTILVFVVALLASMFAAKLPPFKRFVT
ncbi:MAG: acyltransferase [Opitutaceae bacterium]